MKCTEVGRHSIVLEWRLYTSNNNLRNVCLVWVDFSPQFLIVIRKVECISLMVYIWTMHSISTMSYLSVN
jgi:hypothetical protein